MKNWWGEEAHPSDELVHWSERFDSKDFKTRRKELIAAWDLVHATPELAKAATIVAEWIDYRARSNEAENLAGEKF